MKKRIIKLLVILIAFFLLNNLFVQKAQAAACANVPITGDYIVNDASGGCAFAGTVTGVDTGSGTTNTAKITVNSGKTLTISSGQTVAYGLITNNGTIVLTSGGVGGTSALTQKPIYLTDTDSDGYPDSTTQNTTSGRRRNLMTSISVVDCATSDNTKYQDLTGYDDTDGDGYTTATTSQICSGASIPAYNISTNPWRSAANGTDCNDTSNTVYQNITGYTDVDGDGKPLNSTPNSICSGAALPAGYTATSSPLDCLDSDADVYQTVANIVTEADNDGYYVGSPASTCVGATSVISGRTYYKNTGGLYDYAVSTAMLGGSDCNDASATTWVNRTGYDDTDGDGYTTATTNTECSGASFPAYNISTNPWRGAANGSDCNDASATTWQNLTGYTDADGDGWPASATPVNNICSGASVPSGYIGSLPANGQGSDIASITSTTALPALRDSFAAATATIGSSTYIYAIGGTTDLVTAAGASSTVFKATINNSTGEVGTWSTTGQAQLPTIEKHMGVTGHALNVNGTHYLYGIGKYYSGQAWSTIYKFLLSSSGDVTSITSAGNFPVLIYDNMVEGVTIGSSSYVYSVAGWPVITSTYTSTINNTTGNIGTTTADNALPATRYNGSIAVAKMSSGTTYLYYTGGWNGGATDFSTVYKTTIDSAGGMGAWATSSQMIRATDAHGYHMPLVVSGPKAFMYHLTGWSPPLNFEMSNVYKASIDATGAVSAFSATNQTQLTSSTTSEANAMISARVNGTDDYIYILGGYNLGTANDTAGVLKASFNQTNIDCNDADAALHPDSGC